MRQPGQPYFGVEPTRANADIDNIEPKPRLFAIEKSDGINASRKARDMLQETDFYMGFNHFIAWWIMIGSKITPSSSDDLHILVDGLNIIRNPSILLGFLPSIKRNLPDYAPHVIKLITSQLNNSTLDYENMKLVLDNVLLFILANIYKPLGTKLYLIQHIGNLQDVEIESGFEDRSNEAREPIFDVAQWPEHETEYYGIKLPKIVQDGLSYVPAIEDAHQVIGLSGTSFNHVVTTRSRLYSKENAMKGNIDWRGSEIPDPDFTYNFEADDVFLCLLKFFMERILNANPARMYILSGDNYDWFLDRELLANRLVIQCDMDKLEYTLAYYVLEQLERIVPTFLVLIVDKRNNGIRIWNPRFLDIIASWDFIDISSRKIIIEALCKQFDLARPQYLFYAAERGRDDASGAPVVPKFYWPAGLSATEVSAAQARARQNKTTPEQEYAIARAAQVRAAPERRRGNAPVSLSESVGDPYSKKYLKYKMKYVKLKNSKS